MLRVSFFYVDEEDSLFVGGLDASGVGSVLDGWDAAGCGRGSSSVTMAVVPPATSCEPT